MKTWFGNIFEGIQTSVVGLRITWQHFRDALFLPKQKPVGAAHTDFKAAEKGIFTVNYPHESLPIPEKGRYQLHNEISDCILCDKCADICPVKCIEIESIRSTEVVQVAKDGTPIRMYAAKFDIDMAKCCYCGLCTMVCPTECLTMTPNFDYSEFRLDKMIYHFSTMTSEEIEDKKSKWEESQKNKKQRPPAAKSE